MGRSGYDTSGLGTSAKPSRAAHKATGAGEDGSGAKGKKAGASKRKPDGAAVCFVYLLACFIHPSPPLILSLGQDEAVAADVERGFASR